MDKQAKRLLEKSAERIRVLREEVDSFKEQAEAADRVKLAEQIAVMKASDGVIAYEDLLDERDKLAASDTDLEHLKTAMEEFGPSRVAPREVSEVATPKEKTAASSPNEPPHLARARKLLQASMSEL